MTGGEYHFNKMLVGFTASGTYLQTDGIMEVASLIVGNCAANIPGQLTLSGGTLSVINPTQTAVLDDLTLLWS